MELFLHTLFDFLINAKTTATVVSPVVNAYDII
nr:MAG TPA: hypothetical protein [Caudoviricetes sp.]